MATTFTQIKSVNLSTPTLGAITNFFTQVSAALAKADPEVLNIKPQADRFAANVENLALVQNKKRAGKSVISMADADQQRDAVINFLVRYTNTMKTSPVAAEAAAARSFATVISAYPDLATMEMGRETTQVDGLLRDLTADEQAEEVATLKLAAYIEALDNAQANYKAADLARAAEQQARAELAGGLSSKELRLLCTDDYREIVPIINAMAILQPSPEVTTLISEVNGYITRMEQSVSVEKGANAHTTEEPAEA